MDQGLIVRLRPAGPWRFGSHTGASHEAGDLYHSDSVYSAVTHMLAQLGELETWLSATAEADGEPAVSFSSCYPWLDDDLFIVPPHNLWPPSSPAMLGLRNARFVPLRALARVFRGEDLPEDKWTVDAASRCLVRSPRRGAARGPFRPAIRHAAAVDRLSSTSGPRRRIACVEFAANAGLWLAVAFASDAARDRWGALVETAFRALADSGLGGRRSAGWGRFAQPEFTTGSLAKTILPDLTRKAEPPAVSALEDRPVYGPQNRPENKPEPVPEEAPAEQKTGHWMLSLFHPNARDAVNWESGSYSVLVRGGRVESSARSGEEKRIVRMVSEGSVIVADNPPIGAAANVAPEGFPHPVYRYGRPVSLPVPLGGAA
jgi:CRISPR type III-A-associated RAMP protein Csm4